MKSLQSRIAYLVAFTFIAAQLVQVRISYAAPLTSAKVKPPAIPTAPLPQWPPCSSNPCAAPDTPHWFYLRNVASVKAGQPLVMTVTTPPQASPEQPAAVSATRGHGRHRKHRHYTAAIQRFSRRGQPDVVFRPRTTTGWCFPRWSIAPTTLQGS
jgi:hypothetical protein